MVCSSSMKTMVRPSSCASSFRTALRRSSNSPRYLAPASSAAMSSESTRLFLSVSGTSLQDLDHAADLVVAADHRVELARARALGEIERVFLQRLAAPLGFLAPDRLSAAHRLDRLVDRLLAAAVLLQQAAGLALVFSERKQKQLGSDELVAALLRFLVSEIEESVQLARDLHLAAVTLDLGQARNRLLERP